MKILMLTILAASLGMIPGIDDPSKAEHLAAHIYSRKVTADQVLEILAIEDEKAPKPSAVAAADLFWQNCARAVGVARPSRKARVLVAELVTKLEANRG